MQKEEKLSDDGLNTKVTAVDRPVTTHEDVSTTEIKNEEGHSEQILDRNYYFNLLRSKNNDILCEINKMKQEVEGIEKDKKQ